MPTRWICVALLLGTCSLSRAAPIAQGQASLSDICGECHKDIYRMWRGSAHAQSMEGPVFLEAFRETEAREGAGTSRVCLGCHAPLVRINGDWRLEQKASWEGVSCDVCHSLVAVDLSRPGSPLVLEVGRVKRGPIRDAASTAHEVAYSALHTGPMVCAGCHEYKNGEGTPIITTYTEWTKSSAAKDGGSCQACHMGRVKAHVVDPKVARLPETEVNLHEMPGGHSLQQLHKALTMAIRIARNAKELRIEVELKNKGAGHAVPTGMPGRRVILELTLRGGGGPGFKEQRVYSKTFQDKDGSVITKDGRYFTRGVRLLSDTRIRPDETRTESFRFPAPSATAFLAVSMHYEHAPSGGAEGRTWITFQSERRTILPGID
jgi:hypothetical protein